MKRRPRMQSTLHERFREYLTTQGKRFTRERHAVADEVFRAVLPFTVDELVERLRRWPEGSRVSRSTVYRTFMELERAGLVRPSEFPGKFEFYDPNEYT